jgi:hypothetical protein
MVVMVMMMVSGRGRPRQARAVLTVTRMVRADGAPEFQPCTLGLQLIEQPV